MHPISLLLTVNWNCFVQPMEKIKSTEKQQNVINVILNLVPRLYLMIT